MFESKSEVVKIPPGTFCAQVPEIKESITFGKFLGPLGFLVPFTGLDCSVVALSKVDPRYKVRAWITQLFALLLIAVVVFRCYTFFQLKLSVNSMSLEWAESGMIAFMGVQSVECAYCIFSWTRRDFISSHLEKLEEVRQLRIKDDEKLDNYSTAHFKILAWTTIWTVIVMAHAVACAVQEKVILSGFHDDLPFIQAVILNLNVFATLFMTYFSLKPVCNVQFQLQDTSRILMESREFEKSNDSDVMNTYHIMIDRSLRHTARLRVLGGIPIYPTTFNIAMFFIPNLGILLSFVKKSLHSYGFYMECCT
ncbi:unnamed protein product [Caenorhabditis nigoni]